MSKERWNADLRLLHEHLEAEGNMILDGCEEDNPHDTFAGKLYLIASAEIDALEADLADTKHKLAYRTKELERAEEDIGYKDHTIEALEVELKEVSDSTSAKPMLIALLEADNKRLRGALAEVTAIGMGRYCASCGESNSVALAALEASS